MAQYDKKILSVSLSMSGTVHHLIVIFGTNVQNENTSSKFFIFQNFDFWGF